jgi:predicted transcriptional regulator YdeE
MPVLPDRLLRLALLARVLIVVALVVTLYAAPFRKDASMNPQIVDEPGFSVIGIQARTSNAKEMTPDGVIGRQWATFMKDNLAAQIPNKANAAIVAVYTDYATDKDGEYSFILGCRVTSTANIPAGMIDTKVPTGRYAIFTSAKGPIPKIVVETWQKIWSVPKNSPGGGRSYKADYELYDERASEPETAQIEIHIGIK